MAQPTVNSCRFMPSNRMKQTRSSDYGFVPFQFEDGQSKLASTKRNLDFEI
ncbi:unnamed protein product, partial [Linum tenue]